MGYASIATLVLAVLIVVLRLSGFKLRRHRPTDGAHETDHHLPAAPAARAHGDHVESHGHGHGGNGWAGATIFLVVVALIVAAGLYTWKDGWWRGPEIHPGVATSAAENYDTDPSHYCRTKPEDADIHPASPSAWVTVTVPQGYWFCRDGIAWEKFMTHTECKVPGESTWSPCTSTFSEIRFKSTGPVPTWLDSYRKAS